MKEWNDVDIIDVVTNMTAKNYIDRVTELAEELSKDYKEQYEAMEDFARWNLPDETGLIWIDYEYIIRSDTLRELLGNEKVSILVEILDNFDHAFESQPDVWTHQAMQTNEFWSKQRNLAKRFLALLKA